MLITTFPVHNKYMQCYIHKMNTCIKYYCITAITMANVREWSEIISGEGPLNKTRVSGRMVENISLGQDIEK